MRLWTLLLGCSHRRTTFPLTPRSVGKPTRFRRKGGTTYVVCLDCGAEFEYDWKSMRIAGRIHADARRVATAEVVEGPGSVT